ncbi:MAG: phosphate ABC transporter substrate-binding protein PstS [Terriglobia bacterium]
MKTPQWSLMAVAAIITISFISCSGDKNSLEDVPLQGAGATFPAPLYQKWFKVYSESHDGVQVDYQSIGSGGGVKSVIDKTVDFGASDAAMSPAEMAKVKGGVQLLPLTAGCIVLSYNLQGVTGLKLSRAAYAGIFLGKVKMWNDPLIAKDNPGLSLPDEPINVIVRSDGSGTTYVFTQHLSAISPEFARSPGVNKLPNWPTGTRSKGNEGVSASISMTPGSIGYIEYGFAKTQDMPMAILENKSGSFVAASTESVQSALATAKFSENLIAWVPDPDAKNAYPIATYTWLICYKHYNDKRKFQLLQSLLTWCATDGQKESEALGYVPLPQAVVEKDKAAIQNITLAPNAT